MNKNKLKDKANKLFLKGNYKKAVSLFKQIYELDPKDEKMIQLRIALCFEKMDKKDDAIYYYIHAAKDFAKSGFFLKAIATLKNVLELEPTHLETQELIADLYAKNGKFYQPIAKSTIIKTETLTKEEKKTKPPVIEHDTERDKVTKEYTPELIQLTKEQLIEENSAEDGLLIDDEVDIISAEDSYTEQDIFGMQIVEPDEPIQGVIDASEMLAPIPDIPLFSELDRDVFIEVMNKMVLKKYKRGHLIIKEGDDAKAFYIISEGQVKVKKEIDDGEIIELAKLGRGDFFGEMAIIGDAKRTASIEAIDHVELFELSKSMIDDIMKKYSSVRKTLYKFYKNRLLYNLINASPFFNDIPKSKRVKLLRLFKSKHLPPNHVLIKQNGEIPGLFIIVDGSVKVYRFIDGTRQDILSVSRGAILGEISILTGKKPVAYCTTISNTWVLRLPPEDFNKLKDEYPEVITYLDELKSNRIYELDLIKNLKIGMY